MQRPTDRKNLITVFSFSGGPHSSSKGVEENRLPHYQLIVADYIGFGLNEIHPIKSGVDDQFLDLDVYARLIELVIRREIDAGNVEKFVIEGGSYGSVGATIVASHLSKLKDPKYKPSLVLLNKVVTYKDHQIEPSSSEEDSKDKDYQIEWVPRTISGKVCILPKGLECFDDVILAKLTNAQQRDTLRAFEEMYRNFTKESKEALPWFFRDALHWEAAQQPAKAANFLREVILPGGNFDYSKLRCWFEINFDHLPWNTRYESASSTASIESHLCQAFQSTAGQNCGCFRQQGPYTARRYQIVEPTPILYINGTEDSQTSLEGALTHFESQENSNTRFIKLCGIGHEVFFKSQQNRLPGQIDKSDVIDQFFKSGLKGIQIEEGHCQ